MNKDLVIETNMLTKKYGNQTAVNNINLHIEKGKIYGLLGRNGAGKTTTLKMILGLVTPTSGNIKIFGENLFGNEKSIHPRIGSIIETPGFYPNLTAKENLQVFARLRGTIKKNAIIDALNIVNLPHDDKKPFSSYSLGMKQRLGIANAILNDPEILILDEPTNGLDPIGISEIRAFLIKLSQERGISIIISSHILSEISLIADNIGIINNGYLLEECSMDDLKSKNKKYIHIKVSSISKSSFILENILNIKDFSIEPDNFIKIYDTDYDLSLINDTLVKSDIKVSSLQICNNDLEYYFKKITGGEGIA